MALRLFLACLGGFCLISSGCGDDDITVIDGDADPDFDAAPDPDAGPSCGNGATEGDEACDDGDNLDTGGCSAECNAATCLVPVTHETIQAGIDDGACATVWVMPGTYTENLVIERDVAIEKTGVGDVVVDGGGDGRVITQNGELVRLTGFSVQNGADEIGAGINNTGFLVLDRMHIVGNTAEGDAARGGGIYNQGFLYMDASEVAGNTVTDEGSVAVAMMRGGGIASISTLVINRSQIHDNQVLASGNFEAAGGGIAVLASSNAVLSGGTVVTNNRAEASNTADDAAAFGGGIAVTGTDGGVELREGVLVSNNSASATSTSDDATASGGGIGTDSGTLSISSSSIIGNSVTATGVDGASALGAAASAAGGVSILSAVVAENISTSSSVDSTAYARAALDLISSDGVQISQTSITGNQASAASTNSEGRVIGSGIFVLSNAGVVISSSTISGNTAVGDDARGAGIVFGGLDGGSFALVNTTIAANVATGDVAQGGGVYLDMEIATVALQVRNATVTGNQAAEGGGFYLVESGTLTATFSNSIVHGNAATTSPETACAGTPAEIDSEGYNIWGDTTGCTVAGAGAGDDITGMDPLLGSLLVNGGPTATHLPGTGSPAIDGGDPAGCDDGDGGVLAVDQRDLPRPAGLECDIGSVEVQ